MIECGHLLSGSGRSRSLEHVQEVEGTGSVIHAQNFVSLAKKFGILRIDLGIEVKLHEAPEPWKVAMAKRRPSKGLARTGRSCETVGMSETPSSSGNLGEDRLAARSIESVTAKDGASACRDDDEETGGWFGIDGLSRPTEVGGGEPDMELLRRLARDELSRDARIDVYRKLVRYRNWVDAMAVADAEVARELADRRHRS